MARDVVDLTPIESRDELVAWFARAQSRRRSGASGPSTRSSRSPPTRTSRCPTRAARSIRSLLVGMQHLLGWEPIMDGPNIIGLADVTGGGAISLEPGGQFELSGAPVETMHQTCRELNAHLAQVREIGAPLGIGFLGLGMTPKWTRARDAADAEEPLRDHDGLHAEGRHARPRHDVPHLHRAGEPRLRLRSRHGEEAARLARAAAGRDRAVRQLAVHRRQAERLPVLPLGDLARHRQSARRHAAVRVRGRLGLRALCRLRARRADVFRQSRATSTSTSPACRSATCSPASCPAPGEARDACRTGRTTCRRFSPKCG